MKKVIIFTGLFVTLLVCVMMVLLYKNEIKEVPLSRVEERILNHCDRTGMEKGGMMRMKRAFSLNGEEYKEFLYYMPDNTMSVNEILVIKMNSEEQGKSILEQFEHRLEVQKKNFDGYGTDQTELLNHGVFFTEGPYAVFVVGRDAEHKAAVIKESWEE